MYRYKRKIDSIESIRKSAFVLSDRVNTVVSLNSDFTVNKPFHGLYIKNGKVIISNLFEEIETKSNKYKVSNILSNNINVYNEYISSIDLENFTIEYDMDDFYFSKKIYLEEKTGILAVEYYIKNKSEYNSNFKVYPAITYRNIYNMKNSSMLRFNQRNEKNGVVINLSISNQEDVILKSNKFEWNKDVNILNDIKYKIRKDNFNIEEYIEDLMSPGYFDIQIKGNSSITAVIYITSKNQDITKLNTEELSKKDFFLKENISSSIENEYIELKELSYSLENLKFENKIITSLPYTQNNILNLDAIKIDNNNLSYTLDTLIDATKAIDGEFLSFSKVKEATRRIIDIKKYIEYISKLNITDYQILYKFLLLKLWCIESINRIVQKQDLYNIFTSFVKSLIESIFNDNMTNKYFKNIEAVSLMYNALKIYEDMLKKDGKEEEIIFEKQEYFREKIEKEFWNEEKRAMKKNLDEQEIYANVQMLYTISLSYPCIVNDISFKLLDTVFKELYTPYGLREYSKNSEKNTGLIYPKYMAHFVKANLRQNGVTRASRKIAFNLVKDLFLDINKYLNCGIKKVYSEKGYQIDTLTYDLLTNAEIIRLYDMLL